MFQVILPEMPIIVEGAMYVLAACGHCRIVGCCVDVYVCMQGLITV